MAVFLSILLALALVAGIVYILRRYQERAIEETAERHTPLPPIDRNIRKQVLATDESSTDAPDAPSAPVPDAAAAPAPDNNWQQTCQQLKAAGRLEEALAFVQQIYPQWSAFEQQAVILRMQIREQKKQGKDVEPLATALYQAAARASCLHDRPADMPPPPTGRKLAEAMPLSTLQSMDMPYDRIGHRHLRLLTKTDRRMLVDLWGEPSEHVSARTFHALTFTHRKS